MAAAKTVRTRDNDDSNNNNDDNLTMQTTMLTPERMMPLSSSSLSLSTMTTTGSHYPCRQMPLWLLSTLPLLSSISLTNDVTARAATGYQTTHVASWAAHGFVRPHRALPPRWRWRHPGRHPRLPPPPA